MNMSFEELQALELEKLARTVEADLEKKEEAEREAQAERMKEIGKKDVISQDGEVELEIPPCSDREFWRTFDQHVRTGANADVLAGVFGTTPHAIKTWKMCREYNMYLQFEAADELAHEDNMARMAQQTQTRTLKQLNTNMFSMDNSDLIKLAQHSMTLSAKKRTNVATTGGKSVLDMSEGFLAAAKSYGVAKPISEQNSIQDADVTVVGEVLGVDVVKAVKGEPVKVKAQQIGNAEALVAEVLGE